MHLKIVIIVDEFCADGNNGLHFFENDLTRLSLSTVSNYRSMSIIFLSNVLNMRFDLVCVFLVGFP